MRIIAMLLVGAALVACGPASQHEILTKAEGAETKQALEAAIGAPGEVDKMGPVEKWTYPASDGAVEFLITGDSVTLSTTRDGAEGEGTE